MLIIKLLFIKKYLMSLFSLLKMKKYFYHMGLSSISLEQYWWKSLGKSGRFRKNTKRGMAISGVVYRKGIQTFCTLILGGWKGGPESPELLGELNWRGDLIWKGEPQTPLHAMYIVLLYPSRVPTAFSKQNFRTFPEQNNKIKDKTLLQNKMKRITKEE